MYDLSWTCLGFLLNWGGGGGGGECLLMVFGKYVKNGLTDLHQTLRLLRQLYS